MELESCICKFLTFKTSHVSSFHNPPLNILYYSSRLFVRLLLTLLEYSLPSAGWYVTTEE